MFSNDYESSNQNFNNENKHKYYARLLTKLCVIIFSIIFLIMSLISVIMLFMASFRDYVIVLLGLIIALIFILINMALIVYCVTRKGNYYHYAFYTTNTFCVILLGIITIIYGGLSIGDFLATYIVNVYIFILLSNLCFCLLPLMKRYDFNQNDSTNSNNENTNQVVESTIYNEQQRMLEQELAEERQRYKVLQLQQELNAIKQQTDNLINNAKENKD